MTSKAATHRFVGRHVDNLHGGQQLEPGGLYHLDRAAAEHPENARLFDEGLLLELSPRETNTKKEGDAK